MSLSAMKWAWDQKDCGRGKAHELLIALADMANEHGVCWPSQQHLVEKLSCCAKTIKRNAHKLELLGKFGRSIQRRRNKDGSWYTTVRYQLPIAPKAQTVPLEPKLRKTLPSEEATPPEGEDEVILFDYSHAEGIVVPQPKQEAAPKPVQVPPPAVTAPPPKPSSFPWHQALALVMKLTALTEAKARKMLGKIKAEANANGKLVLQLLNQAMELDGNPIPWILGALAKRKADHQKVINDNRQNYDRYGRKRSWAPERQYGSGLVIDTGNGPQRCQW